VEAVKAVEVPKVVGVKVVARQPVVVVVARVMVVIGLALLAIHLAAVAVMPRQVAAGSNNCLLHFV